MPQIFISYSRKDLAIAEKIINALAKDDLEPWIDWKSIPKGEKFEEEIYQGVEESETFLFLISPDSAESEWCNKEIEHAIKNGKRILPIVIRDTEPKLIHPEISKRNWIFCRDGQDDFNRAIGETGRTIHTDYEWLKYHTELQVKALKWEQKKDASRLLRGKELREAELWSGGRSKKLDPKPTKLQFEYTRASQSFEKRQQRRATILTTSVVIVMFVLGIFGFFQRSIADERDRNAATEIIARQTAESLAIYEASLRRSEQIGSVALEQLNSQPDVALLLSVEAFQLGDTPLARKALTDSLSFTRCISRYYYVNGAGVTDVLLSGDGTKLFAGNARGDVYMWDLANGVNEEIIGNGKASQLDINFDSSLLALSNSGNALVTIRNANTLEIVGEINTNFESIFDLKFGNQNNILAVAGTPSPYIELWDIANGIKIDHSFRSEDGIFHQNYVYEVAFNNDDTRLAAAGGTGTDGLIIFWDLASGQDTATYISPPDDVTHPMAFDSLGLDFSYGSLQQIIVNGEYYGIDVEPINTPSNVLSLLFKPSGSALVSGHADGIIRWWDLSNSGTEERERLEDVFTGHVSAVNSLSIIDNSSLLASGDDLGIIVLWTPHDCHPEYTYEIWNEAEQPPDPDVASIALSIKTGKKAVAKYGNKDIQLVALADNHLLEILHGESDQVDLMTFSNSGNHLAVVESINWSDAAIRVWNLESPARENRLIDISLIPNISAISFDNKESVLAIATDEEKIYFYNLVDNRFIAEPITHAAGDIVLLAYSSDNRLLASMNRAGKTILWTTTNMLPIAEKDFSFVIHPYSALQFSDESTTLFVSRINYGNGERSLSSQKELEWMISPDRWMEIICSRVGRNLNLREWERYFPDESYHLTCPQWPAGE